MRLIALFCSQIIVSCAAPWASAESASKPDLAVIVIEKLDKSKAIHQVMMSPDECGKFVQKVKKDGPFLDTIKFPESTVHGLIVSWSCIRPDGTTISSEHNLPSNE